MKKRLFGTWGLLAGIVLLTLALNAQNNRAVDSVRKLLPGLSGKERVKALNFLGWEIKFNNPDSTKTVSQQALELARRLKDNHGQALANRNLAALCIIQGKSNEALPYAEEAYRYIQKTDDVFQTGKILNLIGIAHREQKNFRKALDYQYRSLEVFRQLRDTFEIAGNLNNLGMIHLGLGNTEQALKLYQEVYDLELKRGNQFGISRTANNLAGIYQQMGLLGKAEKMFRISIEAAKAINNKQYESASIHGLGLFYERKGNYEQAIEEYKKAIAINRASGFYEYLGNNLIQMANSYSLLNKTPESIKSYEEAYTVFHQTGVPWSAASALNGMAREYLGLGNLALAAKLSHQALRIGDSLNDLKVRNDSHRNLYLISKANRNFEQALGYLELYVNETDSIQNREKTALLNEIETRYEVKTIEADNERLKSENQIQQQVIRNQRIFTISAVTALLVISLMAMVIARGRKKLGEANRILSEKNDEILKQTELLKVSNATKDKLFSIIAHDIRNPFSALLNLSELLKDEALTAERESLAFYAANIHVTATNTFNLLDNLLFWSKSQRGAIEIRKEDCNLRETVNSAFQTALAGTLENHLSLVNSVPPEITLLTDKTLLRIILGNLAGNAVKFNKPGGSVTISYQHDSNAHIIRVTDTGAGIPEDRLASVFSKEESFMPGNRQPGSGTGLGLILCHEFTQKLGGTIAVKSETGKGTEFTLVFPE